MDQLKLMLNSGWKIQIEIKNGMYEAYADKEGVGHKFYCGATLDGTIKMLFDSVVEAMQ